jgi:uncharacterized Ntn-hydrolase superfamily protein
MLAVIASLALATAQDHNLSATAHDRAPRAPTDFACTFSIVAYDADKSEWGVAVASKYLAVGSAVPWAKAGVGAIATQAAVNTTYGSHGLELLADGKSAEEALKNMLDTDSGSEFRQVAVIDAKGRIVQHTGKKCQAWAGHKEGKNCAVQGNLLAGEEVVDKMAKAFEDTQGPLAWRLMAALEAGEQAGGDKRGKQSAAILVVRDKGGPNGLGDRAVDLRVDDHEKPIQELARMLELKVQKPKGS